MSYTDYHFLIKDIVGDIVGVIAILGIFIIYKLKIK